MISDEIVIGITMGDPGGIGPEIVVKALSDPLLRQAAKFIIFGIDEQLEYAADLIEVDPFWGRHQHEKLSRDYPNRVVLADYDDFSIPAGLREPNIISGQVSAKFCLDAISAARRGIIDGIVTAPISKESWKKAKFNFPGHTELLASQCKCSRVAMMFTAGSLNIALATIHQGLFDLRNTFTIGKVFEPIDLMNDALKNYFAIPRPKIGVAALNPHAGDEEIRIIRPAIEMAISQGINAFGPYPADTLFLRASRGEFDGVVAMYHDQGMIPIKLLAFNTATNVTIGLPIIRTSPAHGTAFDISWLGKADASSMTEAIKVAIKMARVKKLGHRSNPRLRR